MWQTSWKVSLKYVYIPLQMTIFTTDFVTVRVVKKPTVNEKEKSKKNDKNDNPKNFDGNHLIISSSSCRATSADIPDPLSPLLPIVHCFWQVLRATFRILTELLYVGSSWSYYFSWPYEGVHGRTILMRSSLLLQQCLRMSGSSNIDSFRDGR